MIALTVERLTEDPADTAGMVCEVLSNYGFRLLCRPVPLISMYTFALAFPLDHICHCIELVVPYLIPGVTSEREVSKIEPSAGRLGRRRIEGIELPLSPAPGN